MITAGQLEKIGLTTYLKGAALEARLELSSSRLLNPLTRSYLDEVIFTVVDEQLIIVDPPEMVGLPPVALRDISNTQDMESVLSIALSEHLMQLQRRSTELQTLGLVPQVDPSTLTLEARIDSGETHFLITSDKRGNFRLSSVKKNHTELLHTGPAAFELSEFRQLPALVQYLTALVGEVPPPPSPGVPEAPPAPGLLLTLEELSRAFGSQGLLPPKTALEILVQVKVGSETLRFAAARVYGHTFRGLLAGSKGKLWAERFELPSFPGVTALVAQVLQISPDSVVLVGPDGG